MSAYGSNEKALVEVSPMSVGIHNDVEITKIEAVEIVNKVGKKFNLLDFTFENAKGETHLHRLFNPDTETDPNKKAKKQVGVSNFVAYIATKVNGKPCIFSGEGVESWEDFTTAAIELIGDGYLGKKFQVKLLGNVYKGKASIVIPNYTGWIEPQESEKRLKFSPSEKKGNLEYKAFYETVQTSKPSAPSADGVAEDELPF